MKIYTCSVCSKTFESESFAVNCLECHSFGLRKLTQKQYVGWLKTQRQRIIDGLEFWGYDDETIGNKDTQASWGMCNDSSEIWPQDTWRFPNKTKPYGKNVDHIIGEDNQHCPFDNRSLMTNLDNGNWGCFYRCRIFQKGLKDRQRAIKLYDKILEKYVEI